MYQNGLELSVLVNGKPVKEIPSQGKVFVEARRGTQYSLRLKNNNHRRVMAIFSVDGIDVIKGKKAGDAEVGYVIEAFSSVEVKGYRINDSEVAQFAFTDTQASYANIVGGKKKDETYEQTTKNNGVIGVKVVFEEAFVYPKVALVDTNNITGMFSGCSVNHFGNSASIPRSFLGAAGVYGSSGPQGPIGADIDDANVVDFSSTCCSDSTSVCDWAEVDNPNERVRGMSSSPPTRKLMANAFIPNFQAPTAPKFDAGTTWGQKVEDKVTKTSFKKSKEETTLVLFYAFRESLIEAGIEVNPTKKIAEYPNPFEASEQYCKVPTGYRA